MEFHLLHKRLAEQRVAIYTVIHDNKVTPPGQRHLDLSVDQWDLLSQLLVVLKPLQMATTALCAEKTVLVSLTCPVVDGLLKHHLKIKEDDLGAVIAFKEVVSQELVRRFQFDKDSVAVLAAAVDPHSHLTCFTPMEQSQVQDILHEEVQHMISASQPMEGEKEAPPRKKRKETAMSFC